MKCPNCTTEMIKLKELSRGMGNQSFTECPVCGLVVLWSGDNLTQSWPPLGDQEGGCRLCHSDHTVISTIA